MLQEYKKLLSKEVDINAELLDLLKECFDDIFGKDSRSAKNELDDMLNYYEYNGCLNSLECIKNNIRLANERHAKWLADQEAKKGEE